MPNTSDHTFSDLWERGLMTPTYLSSLLMQLILPAQFAVDKRTSLHNDGKTSTINHTHTATPLSIDGIETLEILQKHNNNQTYEIFCCGNQQDAMQDGFAAYLAEKQPNKNHILWNYPGVGGSAGHTNSAHDLIEAGYKQAKRLLDQKIPAEKITLHGLSLGGAVATQVAQRLHEEGHLVHLEVDRSFAQIARVLPAKLEKNELDTPLFTSVIALSLSGLALGTTLAGLVGSIGVVLATLATPTIKPYIEDTFNVLGSVVGGILAIAGLVVGVLAGLALGALLSVQYLWTDEALIVPITCAFSAVLYSTCCEMDSVDAMDHILKADNKLENCTKKQPTINVINTVDDEVIEVEASLNVGLGFRPGQASQDDETQPLQPKINSFWFEKGGHGGEPHDPIHENHAYGVA